MLKLAFAGLSIYKLLILSSLSHTTTHTLVEMNTRLKNVLN